MSTNFSWMAKLSCNNPDCLLHGPIFLHYPNLPETVAGPPNWPKDDWQAFALCHLCGHGYTYTKEDVQWGKSQDFGLWLQNVPLRLLLKCDQVGCQSPVLAYSAWPIPARAEDIRRKIIYGNGSATCENNHEVAVPLVLMDFESLSRQRTL
jgi:hypothetical protein